MSYEKIKSDMRKAANRAYNIKLQSGDGRKFERQNPGSRHDFNQSFGMFFWRYE